MTYEDIKPLRSYYTARYPHEVKKKAGRKQRRDIIMKYFVIKKDDANKRVEVTTGGAPPRWVDQHYFRYWQTNNQNEETGQEKAESTKDMH